MPRLHSMIMLIALALPVLSQADYHYVSHTGSNEYPYTSWETAADSITPAMNAASPGDTIYIGAGDYQESVWAGPEDTCLAFIGAGIDSTHVWENTTANMWMASDNTLVRDIFFEVYDRRTMYGGWDGASITAIHCKFQGPGWGVFSAGNTVVEDCEFYDTEIGISCDGRNLSVRNNFFSAHLYPCHTLIEGFWYRGGIENNIFLTPVLYQDCELLHVAYDQDSVVFHNNLIDLEGHGPWIDGARRPDISNNTIGRAFAPQYPRLREGFQIQRQWLDSREVKLYNNVILNADVGISAYRWVTGDSIRASIGYNCFWNDSSDIVPDSWDWIDTIGNIDTFPMFVNPDSFDYRLQAYSPLIDAGDPNVLDVDGTRSDIGCYGGPGGCSYTYLDLAPLMPDSISGSVDSANIISLVWRRNYEADFNRYQVFRDTFPAFLPSVFNMVAEPDTSFYQDSLMSPSYYYRLTSVDNQGNISDYSEEVAVRPVGIRGFDLGDNLPRYAVISNAYPNPFNQDITIVYSASNLGPQPPEIKLVLYDIQGRVVRTLVDERKPAGTYRIVWDGKDNEGNPVSSGNYIAKLTQWGCAAGDYPVKITLVK